MSFSASCQTRSTDGKYWLTEEEARNAVAIKREYNILLEERANLEGQIKRLNIDIKQLNIEKGALQDNLVDERKNRANLEERLMVVEGRLAEAQKTVNRLRRQKTIAFIAIPLGLAGAIVKVLFF